MVLSGTSPMTREVEMNKWTKTSSDTWTNEKGWTIVKADVRGFSIYDENDDLASNRNDFHDAQFSTLADAKYQVKRYAKRVNA